VLRKWTFSLRCIATQQSGWHHNQSQITNALNSAQSQINSTQTVLQNTQSQVNGFDSSAKQVDQQAQSFAQKNGC
jgi:uncharacterized protein YoxC